ncbi:MAG: DUF1127 domain-containing protein [Paracoccus sp. (in: a-proteobacteria)]|uniref:DUF1127 domain-containing protein n=1 Tax=Paracoccus sp. TaxID=267 RepID=UPI0026E0E61D|nr:DUF1127 domain-containing protein [Paracoccus sp. (in: a-proteobacteria)]MDO5632864.1 DUF1127 domain-containing protein [Paracoccus sp. (in: a-proteobacteria)]
MIAVSPQHRVTQRPGLWQRLIRMVTLTRTRRALAGLDDDRLRDIGLTRAQAEHEFSRWPWDTGNQNRRHTGVASHSLSAAQTSESA